MINFARPGKRRFTTTANPRSFPVQPLSQARRSYTSKKKLQVLTYWSTPSVICEWNPNELVCPTITQVSEHFGGIPVACISEWRKIEEDIVNSVAGARHVIAFPGSRRKWPELDKMLYDNFVQKRAEGQIVRQGWFRVMAQQYFQQCYPESMNGSGGGAENTSGQFCFSRGWFTGFLSHHRITIRFTTNRAQKIPHDYLTPILEFFRFNRRVSQLRLDEISYPTGRYTLSRIVNMDQTPAPFEYLSGRTYALKGSTTVWAKAEKSGWDKRQATIQLTVLADGTMLKPWILFKGKGQLPAAEMDQYDSRVTVKFNPEGYANENIILEWITEQLIPVIQRNITPAIDETLSKATEHDLTGTEISKATGLHTGIPLSAFEAPGLIALDAASFHKTPGVLEALRDANIMPSLIPGGCTSLIQVLDVSVNRPFKDLLKNAMEEELFHLVQLKGEEILAELDRHCDEGGIENSPIDGVISAVGLRRILLTKSVGAAWEKFHEQKKKDSIMKTFRSLGLSLPIDGSCDSELSVKGLLPEELIIGDWTKEPEPPATDTTKETEIDEEADENEDVFFVEIEGSVLQVGKRKKRKKQPTRAHASASTSKSTGGPPAKRRQTACSMCHQVGHNKSNKICPYWVKKVAVPLP